MNDQSTSSAGTTGEPALLSIDRLSVRFGGGGWLGRSAHAVQAVDDVSFNINRGETFGLVGESGSGKSTVGRAVLGLVASASGTVSFEGRPVNWNARTTARSLRRRMQIIFQDPGGSLDPRMRIGAIVAEPMRVHRTCRGRALRVRVTDLLERCGMPPDCVRRYPHQFSGGQRQRIAIARALALEPQLIVCDEPTSALDVSIQSQILNLLRDLQQRLGLSYLFISHDMGVVNHMCDRIGVMKGGRILEQGDRESILKNPQTEYTHALMAAVPRADTQQLPL